MVEPAWQGFIYIDNPTLYRVFTASNKIIIVVVLFRADPIHATPSGAHNASLDSLPVPAAADQPLSPRADTSGVTPRDETHAGVIRIRRKLVSCV